VKEDWLNDQDWTRLLEDDLEKLISLSVPDKKEPSDKTQLQPGERRYVTVLFLDMKGFTALAERFDHETVDGLMNKLFLIFKNHIDKRGGWIEKFEGDAILAAFGARIAHEDDAIRAVDAGWAISDSFRGLGPLLQRQGMFVGVRIGIHSGEVTKSKRAEYDVITGDTVNTAARLEQNAEVGTILVSEATRILAGDHFVYEVCPDVQAKGKAEPIKAFIVKGRAPHRDKWLRSRLTAKTRFVGRQPEMQILYRVHEQCCLPQETPESPFSEGFPKHRLMAIRGEAGIGKSRLVREFACEALNKDQVLKGTAVSFASRPYEMVISMLMDCLGISALGTDHKEKLEAFIGSLAEYLEDSTELKKGIPMFGLLLGIPYDDLRLKHLKPDQLQKEIFIAFKAFLEAMSAKACRLYNRPLVLIWEDFHWADEPSKEALRFLVGSGKTPRPLMIIILSRLDHGLPRVAEGCAVISELYLKPLAYTDESTLIQGVLGEILIPENIRTMIHERASGNPYYIEELIHHLIDRGMVVEDNSRWQFVKQADFTDIPVSLRSLLMARIDALDERAKEILQHASVLGPEFFYQELKWIENRLGGEADPKPFLDELVILSFLILQSFDSDAKSPDLTYDFRHILARDVAYESLLHWNRKILHRLSAEFIEKHYADSLEHRAFELGEHWLASGNSEKAAQYFYKAGEQSQKSYDNLRAIQAFSKAVGLSRDDDSRKSQILRARANVYRFIGRIPEAKEDLKQSLDIARKFKNHKEEADSILAFGSLFCQQGLYEEALPYFEQALRIMHGDRDWRGEAGAIFQMGNVHSYQGRYGLALECFKKVFKIYQTKELRQEEASALVGIGIIYGQQEQFEEALGCYRQSLIIGQEIGDRLALMTINNNIGILHQIQGKYHLALQHYQKSLALSREIGDRLAMSSTMMNIGNVYLEQGQYDDALPLFFEVLWIKKEIGDQCGEGVVLSNIGNIYFFKGLFGDALGFYEQAVAILLKIKMKNQAVLTQAMQARALLKAGESLRAIELSKQAIQSLKETEAEPMSRALDPEQIYFTHYIILSHGKNKGAAQYLKKAYSLLNQRLDKIKDPEDRRNISNNVFNRPILDALDEYPG
jgi:adenylate cyclase